MSSKPESIGMVSGELDGRGKVGKTVEPKVTEEQIEAAEEKAVEVAETIARRKGVAVVTLEDGETEVEVRNAKVGQIGLVLKFLKVVIRSLEIKSAKPEYLQARFAELQANPESLMDLLLTVDENIWDVLAALTSLKGANEVRSLDIDDAVKIGKVAWELNKDFFLKKVLPIALGTIRVK